MLLAAGFGRRMVPITLRRAKPTLPFLNRPLLLRQLDYLAAAGVTEVVVNVHHAARSILSLLAGAGRCDRPTGPFAIGPLTVHASVEEERLGTSGGLKRAAAHFQGSGTFVCLNSDMVTEIDLAAALAAHRAGGRDATLVLVPHKPGSPFTPVCHADGQVLEFARRPPGGGAGTGLSEPEVAAGCAGTQAGVFTGIHLLEPEILARLPEGRSEFLAALYEPMIAAGEAPGVVLSEARWVEVGSAGRYLAEQAAALAGEPFAGHHPWAPGTAGSVAREAHLDRCVLVGEGGRIEAGARLGPGVILGHDVHVGAGADLEQCIALDGARIGPGASLREVVMGAGTVVPADVTVVRALLQGGPATGALTPHEVSPARDWEGCWRVDF